jgi:hypothetical protein
MKSLKIKRRDSKLFVTCDCEGEALALSISEEDGNFPPTLQISFWTRGYDWSGCSIWFKIRTFFHMLKYGHPYTDNIIIEDPKKIDAIIAYLKESRKELKDYYDREAERLENQNTSNHPDGYERYEEA